MVPVGLLKMRWVLGSQLHGGLFLYPLNKYPQESERLKQQFSILQGNWLASLFSNAQGHVLDVGCGTGSLFSQLPDSWYYTGIDINDRFEKTSERQFFFHQDILDFIPTNNFDVIVCRLVLWSIPRRNEVIKKIRDISSAKTILYCFEPDDRDLAFSEELSSVKELAQYWQSTVIPQGCNPYIGGNLEQLLNSNGWETLSVKKNKVVRNENDPSFKDHLSNLVRIFSQCDPLPSDNTISSANETIKNPKGFLNECYYETISRKR